MKNKKSHKNTYIDYIKKSNINPILKMIYLRNKYINHHLFIKDNNIKNEQISQKPIKKRKSSVSHYSVVI